MEVLRIDGNHLNLNDFIEVTRGKRKIELTEEAKEKINRSREVVDRYVREKKVVYGITTGFGKFCDTVIDTEETGKLQRNLIVSHSCSVGEPFPEDIVRGILLLRINNLSKGYSGIRLKTLQTLIDMLNKGVVPVVPEKGSLGASGDLSPLSHTMLPMIGEGEAFFNGIRMSGKEAMDKAGIEVIELSSKEGLALNNGTQVMNSVGSHAVYDAFNLLKHANVISMLTLESLRGITDAYYEGTHSIRNQEGQIDIAENLNEIVEGSGYTTKQGELRVQDPYSLRCIPQIHGASLDCFRYVLDKVEKEMNAVTDNPIIFTDEDRVISGGNFHGQPLALAFDFLKIGLSELADVSERRLERLVNPALSNGLPAFLTEHGGVNSGFMIVQYSAASVVSENKVLAHPASVDSIPSSANQEDHVSMGTTAARQAYEIMGNVRKVLAMELLAASNAIEFRDKADLGKGTRIAYDELRKLLPERHDDRVMYTEINQAEELIKSNRIIEIMKKEGIELK